MRLDDLGFATMTDERARNTCASSPLYHTDLVLTSVCNFRCLYCKPLGSKCQGVLPYSEATGIIDLCVANRVKKVKFTGGEPMTYRQLEDLTAYTKSKGVEHIALATNGSFPLNLYRRLIDLGVDDFAVSLDACCSLVGKAMSGGVGDWERVVSNIRSLSKLTHTSVGIVLNEGNIAQGRQTIQFAQDLGVADIRVIPSSQYNHSKAELYDFSEEVIARYPFLKFRSDNFKVGKTIRGLSNQDSNRCYFVQDDMIVANSWHYPCVIYMREGGNPIGKLGSDFRQQRVAWSKAHNCFSDPICSAYCLDLYRQYNVRANELCTE